MTTDARPGTSRAFALVAALIAVWAVLFTAQPASGLTPAGAETRVGASISSFEDTVEPLADIAAGQGREIATLYGESASATGVAANSAGAVLGDSSKLSGWIPNRIPDAAQETIDSIRASGVDVAQETRGSPGFSGPVVPREFGNTGKNGGHILPRTNAAGKPITYREWGVWQSPDNPRPGGERVVTGSDGSIYYTPTHYQSYIVAVPGR